jgi:hypothetical protein
MKKRMKILVSYITAIDAVLCLFNCYRAIYEKIINEDKSRNRDKLVSLQ